MKNVRRNVNPLREFHVDQPLLTVVSPESAIAMELWRFVTLESE